MWTAFAPDFIRVLAVACGAAAVFLCPLPDELDAQVTPSDSTSGPVATLEGSVRDRQGGQAIAGVRVLLTRGSEGEATAVATVDSVGAFELAIAAGSYLVHFQRIGYKEVMQDVLLEAGVRTELTVSMVPEAMDLDPIVVSVTKRTPWFMKDFQHRKATSIGSFVTRDDIERRNPLRVSDLFRGMPGVRLVGDSRGDNHLVMRGRCIPKVYIDGVSTFEQESIDAMLQPLDVEAMEVYSNASVPIEYASGACGAVLVWTRPPQQVRGRAGWWKPLLVVAGVFGALMLTH